MLAASRLRPLVHWPSTGEWSKCAGIALLGALSLALAATLTGLIEFRPETLTGNTLLLILILFFIPSLGEELLFRWLLFPRPDRPNRTPLIVLSISLFVLWHPLQNWSGFGPDWTALFVEPAFLACVVVLGVTLAALREASGSIWPPTLFHWGVVAVWKILFGGPF